jgi:hypothetical protein
MAGLAALLRLAITDYDTAPAFRLDAPTAGD